MEKVSEQEVRAAVETRNIRRFDLRKCSLCNSPLSYLFDGGQVWFDGNCDCVSYRTPARPSSFEQLAATFNMQTPHVRARMWGEFIAGRAAMTMTAEERADAWLMRAGARRSRAALTATIRAAENDALERAARLCDEADKSTHPADLADAIRALKQPETKG